MKTLLLTFTLVLTLHSATRAQTPTPEPGKVLTEEQELKALDLSWHTAVAARDTEALGRLLADDYQFDLDARRLLNKTQEVAAVGASDSIFEFGVFKLDDVNVKVEGERAFVTGILTARPADGDKKARPRYFYTRTIVQRDGRWQILSSRLVSLTAGKD